MIKLEKCPLCDSKPRVMQIDTWSGYVVCPKCFAQTAIYYNGRYIDWKRQATEAWNNHSKYQ